MELLLILFIGVLVWFWYDSAKAKDLVMIDCQFACQRRNLQFLDGSVYLKKITIKPTTQGFRWYRVYDFEFSKGGFQRHLGHCQILGYHIQRVILDLPPDIDHPETGDISDNPFFPFYPQKYIPFKKK